VLLLAGTALVVLAVVESVAMGVTCRRA
jgi:hypothetical protein